MSIKVKRNIEGCMNRHVDWKDRGFGMRFIIFCEVYHSDIRSSMCLR